MNKKKQSQEEKITEAIIITKSIAEKQKIPFREALEVVDTLGRQEESEVLKKTLEVFKKANEAQITILEKCNDLFDLAGDQIRRLLKQGEDPGDLPDFRVPHFQNMEPADLHVLVEQGSVVLLHLTDEEREKHKDILNGEEFLPALVTGQFGINLNMVAILSNGSTLPFYSVANFKTAVGKNINYWLTKQDKRRLFPSLGSLYPMADELV